MYKQTTLDDESSVLLDPNKLSKDGTVALDDLEFSEDGSLLAYAISVAGSDWVSIKVRDVEGVDYPDVLEQVKFSVISWTHDNKGFFYAVKKVGYIFCSIFVSIMEVQNSFIFCSVIRIKAMAPKRI